MRVACGDVTGDGVPDVIAGAGPGGLPTVQIFNGVDQSLVSAFLAYPATATGGVNVATGDFNGDGRFDIVTGPGPNSPPQVKVFDAQSGALLEDFLAYAANFSGGVRVAAGDVNGDGVADIITGPGAGGAPAVNVFSGSDGARLASFFAFAPSFQGGVSVAAGDVNGDGRADLIAGAGAGGGPQVSVFNGLDQSLLSSFFAFPSIFLGGVNVAAGDLNGDGRADVIAGAGPGAGPQVTAFEGLTSAQMASFLAFDARFSGGVTVAGAAPSSLPSPRLEAAADVTVAGSNVTRLDVQAAGGATTLLVGGTLQCTATATMLDGSVQDVTNQATWSTSDRAVADIGANTGLATGMNAGTANIQATFGGVASSPHQLTVVLPPGRLYVCAEFAQEVASFGPLSAPALQTSLFGPATQMLDPRMIFLDPAGDRLYVADAGQVLVFANASTLTGNQAPVATLGGANTTFNSLLGIFVDTGNDRLYVCDTVLGQVDIFYGASTLSGPVDRAPDRVVASGVAQAGGVWVDVSGDRLFVTRAGGPGPAVLVVDQVTTNAAVTRVIYAGLVSPIGLFLDAARQDLYVADLGGKVQVIANAETAVGTVTPRSLAGPNSTLVSGGGVFMDTGRDQLYVADGDGGTVLVFDNASALNGDVAPVRTLPGFVAPLGIFVDTTR